MKPLVGVGILNFNRADLTIKCLEHLHRITWPADRLQVVVVDNASSDDSAERIRSAFPAVKLLESPVNCGFAGGSNLAIRALAGLDYVALLNNDAFVEPGWLEPLVEAIESNARVGAACSKIVFTTTYLDVSLESPTFRPEGPDGRELGVRVSGVKVADGDRFAGCHFPSGFWNPERGGPEEPAFRWTNGSAKLRVPMSAGDRGATCSIRVCAEAPKPLEVGAGGEPGTFKVSDNPAWIEFALLGEPFDLINNVGSDLVESRHSADRGIFQPDTGQFEKVERVFAWCGCSVLLSRSYLDDVGLFDESFFLYYEDFDLSWRGQRRGWSYLYVPGSVVRHLHAATSGEYSDLFNFYVWRNRLLVLVKNAPTSIAVVEAVGFGAQVARGLRSDLRNRRLSAPTKKMLRAFASFLVHVPAAFADRLALGLRNRLVPLAPPGDGALAQ